jgi:hypothetical protein
MDALLREIHQHPYISLSIVSFLVFTSPLMAALRAVARRVGERALSLAGSLVITSIELSDVSTTESVSNYLGRTGRTHSVGGECYDMTPRTIEASGKTRHIFYRKIADSLSLYFYRGAPILITPIARDGEGDLVKRAQMRFINGTVDMKALLTEAGDYLDRIQEEESRNERAFSITTISPDASNGVTTDCAPRSVSGGADHGGLGEPINYDPTEFAKPRASTFSHRLSFTDAHRQLFQDVRFWKDNRQWYLDAELEYKRGYMLHGKPGTGKTSLISAIAHDLDIPVVIINLSGMTDAQFLRAWKQAASSSQRIVLFEDFDTVFHGRKNVSGTLNFTTVLNAIDGIQGSAGCLLFITTNHIDHIDEAIGRPDENGDSTRAGRIDVIIEIPQLDYEGRLKICKRILRDDVESKAMADSSPHTESPSRLTERCKRRALELLWDKKQ